MQELRVSRAVVIWPEEEHWVVAQYRTQARLSVTQPIVTLLSDISTGASIDRINARSAAIGGIRNVAAIVDAFIAYKILIPVTSEDDNLDLKLAETWIWGPPAGLLHFGGRDAQWVPEQDQETAIYKAGEVGLPSMWAQGFGSIQLEPADASEDLVRLLSERASIRNYGLEELSLKDVAYCLWAGFGGRGTIDDLPGRPPLPLLNAPTPGARNATDAYLMSMGVAGLERGIYKYLPFDHALERVSTDPFDPVKLFGGQDWISAAGAIIVLVARFDRVMSKYRSPTAYTSVMIECGHKSQNVLLAVTNLHLLACPTGAFMHSDLDNLCRLSSTNDAAVYAIALGSPVRSPNPDSTQA